MIHSLKNPLCRIEENNFFQNLPFQSEKYQFFKNSLFECERNQFFINSLVANRKKYPFFRIRPFFSEKISIFQKLSISIRNKSYFPLNFPAPVRKKLSFFQKSSVPISKHSIFSNFPVPMKKKYQCLQCFCFNKKINYFKFLYPNQKKVLFFFQFPTSLLEKNNVFKFPCSYQKKIHCNFYLRIRIK